MTTNVFAWYDYVDAPAAMTPWTLVHFASIRNCRTQYSPAFLRSAACMDRWIHNVDRTSYPI